MLIFTIKQFAGKENASVLGTSQQLTDDARKKDCPNMEGHSKNMFFHLISAARGLV